MPNVLARIRSRLSSNPKMLSTFEETVLPIAKEVRTEMAGKPEDEVYAELTRRLKAKDVDTVRYDDKIHAAAARISRMPAAG